MIILYSCLLYTGLLVFHANSEIRIPLKHNCTENEQCSGYDSNSVCGLKHGREQCICKRGYIMKDSICQPSGRNDLHVFLFFMIIITCSSGFLYLLCIYFKWRLKNCCSRNHTVNIIVTLQTNSNDAPDPPPSYDEVTKEFGTLPSYSSLFGKQDQSRTDLNN